MADDSKRIDRHDDEPEGVVENPGAALGVVDRRVEGQLKRFKEFIEARGQATGAWRGEIRNEDIDRPSMELAGALAARRRINHAAAAGRRGPAAGKCHQRS
jgi:hypothetical protein